ncbi:MAG TPA: GDSL-type esterase/lipase family protein [Bryobacteraceae bacterium]|nr:GDSL-type esterase/lipase family protein [Bryobacteraceae bacterium]
MRSLIVVFATVAAFAQQPAALNGTQAQELMMRSIQLMDAGGVALPELGRAGAPLSENARQALVNIRAAAANLQFLNVFQSNLRAYLLVADSLPKPPDFPDQARQQLAELRDNFARLETYFALQLAQRDRQLRSPDRDNLARYADADTKVIPPQADKPRVVFLGDSITDGWRLNEYFVDRDFINRGISGQITGEMLGRMIADVVALRPQAVLILAGTNDLARGVSLLAIENNLTMIADLADYYKIKVIMASVLPVSDYHKDVNPSYERSKERSPSLIRSLNGWIESFSKDRGFTYLDYFSAMVDDSGFIKPDLADDGLHPNSAGYRVMAPLALAAIDKTVRTAVPLQQKTRRHRLFSQQ